MNMYVPWVKIFKKNLVGVNVVCFLASSITYADYATVYGLEGANSFKIKHPNSTYLIQMASFGSKQNAENYKNTLLKTNKYPVIIKKKSIRNRIIYAVVIGPIKPKENLMTHHVKKTKNVIKGISSLNIQTNESKMKQWWSNSNWYLTIGGGEQFPNSNKTLYINNGSGFPSPYNIDIYSGASRKNGGIFALSGGRTWHTDNSYIPNYTLGVMWQYLFRTNLTGQITQYSDPTFLNYKYELGTASSVILAYSKINILKYKAILPYFNIGLGGSNNSTKNYHEEAYAQVTARVSPGFKSQTNTQFAYLLGAGFDVLASENLSLSAGYNYLSTGSLASGYGVSTWSTSRLNYGSSSTNEVLITLNYKFNKNRILS